MPNYADSHPHDRANQDPFSQRIAELEAQVAAREQELAAYRRGEERFQAALDSMLDPCVIVSSVRNAAGEITDFRLEYANDLACRMSGKRRDQVIGRTLGELDPKSEKSQLFPEYCRVVETGHPLVLTNQAHEEERDGATIHFHFDLQVVKQNDGFVATWRDVTAHAHAVSDLQKSQERLSLALEANHMGLWEWDCEGLPLWSREMCHLFGIPCQENYQVVSAKAMIQAIHPEDYPQTQQLIRQVLQQGRDFHQTFRVVLPDGTIRWIESRGHLLRGQRDRAQLLIGVATDITDRQRLSDQLEEALGMLNGLFESAPVGLAVWDRDLRFRRINPSLAAMNGLPPDEHLGRTPSDLLPNLENIDEIEAQWRKVMETGEPLLNVEVVGTTPATDERRTWREHFYPIHRQDEVIGVGAIVEDITALKHATEDRERLVQELAAERERLAELTGHLEEMVAERTRQVRRLANQLTVAEHEERARISQILHDHIQQMLYGIQMRTHLIAAEADPARLGADIASQLHANLDDLNRLAQDAITVARNLAVELNPPVLDTDDIDSLFQWLADHMHELHGLETRLKLPADVPLHLSDKNRRLLLLHSVRELLFNVVKHADTRICDVEVAEQDGVIHVTVCDRGSGFDQEQLFTPSNQTTPGKKSGLGLSTLRERLRLFEGTMRVHSAPGDGTIITIMLPL